MPCDLCGSPSAGFTAKIEGALLSVCKNCAGGGEIISRPALPKIQKKLPRLPSEMQTELLENFSAIVQRERQRKNLTRADLAKKISVQENLIARIENGWRPPLELIRKLERFFGVQLTENV